MGGMRGRQENGVNSFKKIYRAINEEATRRILMPSAIFGRAPPSVLVFFALTTLSALITADNLCSCSLV
jgi:hypothetical protein